MLHHSLTIEVFGLFEQECLLAITSDQLRPDLSRKVKLVIEKTEKFLSCDAIAETQIHAHVELVFSSLLRIQGFVKAFSHLVLLTSSSANEL